MYPIFRGKNTHHTCRIPGIREFARHAPIFSLQNSGLESMNDAYLRLQYLLSLDWNVTLQQMTSSAQQLTTNSY